MRSLSQVPPRPPTFPLYKARSPGSVTAPWGKLWNRMAGLVSGRADSAVRLPLIPYYPASPLSFSFFSPFLITVSLRPPSFIVALPLPGHSLSQAVREKIIYFCADTKRNLSFKRGCANTPGTSSCSATCLSASVAQSLLDTFPKGEKRRKGKNSLFISCLHSCLRVFAQSVLPVGLTDQIC